MAVRPIDANVAMKKIREYMEDFPNAHTRLAACRAILSMLGDENRIPTLTQPNEPLTCQGCACEEYSRDAYPCNSCSRNDETLSDQYRPPEGEEET